MVHYLKRRLISGIHNDEEFRAWVINSRFWFERRENSPSTLKAAALSRKGKAFSLKNIWRRRNFRFLLSDDELCLSSLWEFSRSGTRQ